jgi:hypothetical protein
MNIRSGLWLMLFMLVVALAGCGDNDNNDARPESTVFARFDPVALPMPNDASWGGGPVFLAPAPDDSPEMAQLKQLVNAQGLPGLSPNMFLTLPLTGAVKSSTLDLLIFRTDDPQLPTLLFAVATGDEELIHATLPLMEFRDQNDFVIVDDFANGVVKLLPKTPFTPGAAYAAVVNDDLIDTHGSRAVSSLVMQALKSTDPFTPDSPYYPFEALRAGFNDGPQSLFNVVAGVTAATTGAPWTRDDVLVMWTFHTSDHTLSLTPTNPEAGTIAYPDGESDPFNAMTANLKGLSTLFTTNALTWTNPATGEVAPGPVGIPAAAMLAGTGIPYDAMGNVYTGYFQSPLFPTGGALTDSVTFRLVLPAAGTGPYPVVIFQHGIGSSKDTALALTNSLASVGYATLAIDAIYHGERALPDADSGEGFFTLNLLQTRANVYQAAVDLWETVDVISSGIDLTGDAAADLDSSRIEFIAHSLGSIIGSTFLTQETRAEKIVLCSPSAVLVNALDESLEPSIQELVASLGYTPGTAAYYGFLDLAQWLLDPIDASYMGIGDNPQSNLMTLYAFGDPIVSPASSQVFLTNLGMDLADITVVDPDDVGSSFPSPEDLAAGAYQYGLKGKPVVHSFLLRPTIDLVAEPYYAGFSEALQVKATTGSQMQVAGFLMP